MIRPVNDFEVGVRVVTCELATYPKAVFTHGTVEPKHLVLGVTSLSQAKSKGRRR